VSAEEKRKYRRFARFYARVHEQLRRTSPWILLKTTVEEWNMDHASRLAAALAYYIIFSMAPLLVVGFAITGMVFEREAVQGQLVDQIARYVNSREVAEFIESMIRGIGTPSTNIFATVVGTVTLLYAASSVFGELREALNLIWDVPPRQIKGLHRIVLNRLLMLAMVIVSGFLLLATLVVDTVMATATTWMHLRWPGIAMLSQGPSFLFFFLVTVLVFALIYKYVPDIRIAWRDVWIGAGATALLFSIGRLLISSYLGRVTAGSSFGAAGTLGLLLIWVYYSAMLFFLGAEFTQVYGRTYGSRWPEYVLIPELPVEAPPQEGEGADDTQVAAPAPSETRRRNFIQPLSDLAIAVGVIGVLSLFNLIRQPFRK
jgi:membrane protein